MKYSKQEVFYRLQQVKSCEEGCKLIWMWMKQDELTPKLIGSSTKYLCKKFKDEISRGYIQ